MVTVPLGFNFTFFGVQYNSVSISSNGLMSFPSLKSDPGYTDYGNTDLTTNTGPNRPIIAPLWNDWTVNPTPPANVFYGTGGTGKYQRFVVGVESS